MQAVVWITGAVAIAMLVYYFIVLLKGDKQ